MTQSISSSTYEMSGYGVPLGLMILLSTASFSTNIDKEQINCGNSFSTIRVYEGSMEYPVQNQDILYGFISNLMNNSEDLDGRIVDMVNENFWDLI